MASNEVIKFEQNLEKLAKAYQTIINKSGILEKAMNSLRGEQLLQNKLVLRSLEGSNKLIENARLRINREKALTNTLKDAGATEQQITLIKKTLNQVETKSIAIQEKSRNALKSNINQIKILRDRLKEVGVSLKGNKEFFKLQNKAVKGSSREMSRLRRETQKLIAAKKKNVFITKEEIKQLHTWSQRIKTATNFTGRLTTAQRKLHKQGLLTVRNTRNSSSAFSVLRSQLLLASFAFGLLERGMIKLVQAYGKQEESENAVASAIIATGEAARVSAQEIFAYSKEMQSMTTFGDEAINNAAALLLTFKRIGPEAFFPAMTAILNVSAAMGQDLKSSVIQVGKALNSPIQGMAALTRVGIQFDEVQKQQIKKLVLQNKTFKAQGILLKELDSQFSGMAATMALNAGGAIQRMNNAFGDLAEVIGEALSPSLIALANVLKDVAEGMVNNKEATLELGRSIQDFLGGIGIYLVSMRLISKGQIAWAASMKTAGKMIKNVSVATRAMTAGFVLFFKVISKATIFGAGLFLLLPLIKKLAKDSIPGLNEALEKQTKGFDSATATVGEMRKELLELIKIGGIKELVTTKDLLKLEEAKNEIRNVISIFEEPIKKQVEFEMQGEIDQKIAQFLDPSKRIRTGNPFKDMFTKWTSDIEVMTQNWMARINAGLDIELDQTELTIRQNQKIKDSVGELVQAYGEGEDAVAAYFVKIGIASDASRQFAQILIDNINTNGHLNESQIKWNTLLEDTINRYADISQLGPEVQAKIMGITRANDLANEVSKKLVLTTKGLVSVHDEEVKAIEKNIFAMKNFGFVYDEQIPAVQEIIDKIIKETHERKKAEKEAKIYYDTHVKGAIDHKRALFDLEGELEILRAHAADPIEFTFGHDLSSQFDKVLIEGVGTVDRFWQSIDLDNLFDLSFLGDVVPEGLSQMFNLDNLLAAEEGLNHVQSALESANGERAKAAFHLREEELAIELYKTTLEGLDETQLANHKNVMAINEQRRKDLLLAEEEKAILESQIETRKVWMEAQLEMIDILSDAWGEYHTSQIDKQKEATLAALDDQAEFINNNIKNEVLRDKKLKELDKKKQEAEKKAHNETLEVKKKMAFADFFMSIAKAYVTIPAIVAANKLVYAMIPGAAEAKTAADVASIYASIAVSAVGLATNIASLNAQKMEKGGMIGGNLHSQGGTIIEAERGEFIMNRNATRNIGSNTLNAMNKLGAVPQGGSGSQTINISFDGNVLSDDFIEDEAIPKIKEAIRRGADIGIS